MTKKKLSLGERIALAASGSQHEEEFPEDIEYETSAKVIDDDALLEDDDQPERRRRAPGRSSLRTKNVQLLDELDTKYAGQKVTRKKLTKDDGHRLSNGSGHLLDAPEMNFSLDEDDDDEDGMDASSDMDGDDASDSDLGVDGEDQEEEEESSGVDDDDEDVVSGSGSEVEVEDDENDAGSDSGPGSSSEVEVDDFESVVGVKTLSARDKQEEIEKGKATLNQIRIWDSLLEVRIRLQKMLLDCSRLPQGDQFQEVLQNIRENDESSKLPKILENGQAATKVLMHELLRLQELMTQGFPDTQKASTTSKVTKSGDSEEITSEDDNEADKVNALSKKKKRISVEGQVAIGKKRKLEDFLESSETSFKKLTPFRNETIKKWNEKTQFAGGKFNRKTASQQISTLRQIEQILGNRERLLKRTQVKRSNYSMIMTTPKYSTPTAEADPETFDDDDFYHQLLRELIERKTTNVNDPIQLSHHWLELQKLRTKLKRKVDTKASKGRRLRYDVHSKLVNFMAPRDNLGMTPAAVKELFGSLFGKKRE